MDVYCGYESLGLSSFLVFVRYRAEVVVIRGQRWLYLLRSKMALEMKLEITAAVHRGVDLKLDWVIGIEIEAALRLRLGLGLAI